MTNIKQLFSPRSSADLAEARAKLDRDIAATEAQRPALVAALDRAVEHEDGVDRAESTLLAHEAEVRRLSLRRGSMDRAHAAAVKREESERIEGLRSEHADALAAAEKAAAGYDCKAAAAAAAARTMAAQSERVDRANRALERAGAEPLAGAPGDHVLRALNLPHSRWDERPHHEAAPTFDPRVVALGEMVRDTKAAGARAVDNVKNVAARMLAVTHSG